MGRLPELPQSGGAKQEDRRISALRSRNHSLGPLQQRACRTPQPPQRDQVDAQNTPATNKKQQATPGKWHWRTLPHRVLWPADRGDPRHTDPGRAPSPPAGKLACQAWRGVAPCEGPRWRAPPQAAACWPGPLHPAMCRHTCECRCCRHRSREHGVVMLDHSAEGERRSTGRRGRPPPVAQGSSDHPARMPAAAAARHCCERLDVSV